MGQPKRLAVLTSGGDAPGMNAAIRAVVRSASAHDMTVYGVHEGYKGLTEGLYEELNDRDVGGILQQGGTMLGSARCPAFRQRETQQRAIEQLTQFGIDGLIVIGGNGSQQGSLALHRLGFPVVGIASTIDNDLAETEITIGVDTALNTATGYIDRLKDTASSHHRAFIVEVMGRDSGYLAAMTAIATGASCALVPEFDMTFEELLLDVEEAYKRKKAFYIAVVAEGASLKAFDIAEKMNGLNESFEARLSVLGHVQRGGSPTFYDRVLASRLGKAAVNSMLRGTTGVVMGWMKGRIVDIPLDVATQPCQKVNAQMMELVKLLSR